MRDVIGWIAVAIAAVAAVALLMALGVVLQTLRAMRQTLAALDARVVPLLDELEATVRRAGDEVDQVETVVGSVEALSRTIEDASAAASKPVVKALAFSAGTRSAWQRFRGRRSTRRTR
ncbi:MAG: hypothetical protein ACOYN3_02515 [Acidimicrobiia bacterium]